MSSKITPDDWLREHAGVPEKIDLGLERCQKVLALLDILPAPFKVITIAGTNGKGSTVAILDSILSEAGLLTGRYSSPHLIRFNERILIGQKELASNLIISAFESIRQKAGNLLLSYFEYSTIAALLLFAEEQVDVALLEVGLGGRLDACNAIDSDIAIITSIALDHQDWLGDDVDKIAYEKAGVARSNKPLILASKNLPKVINNYAGEIDSKVVQCGDAYQFSIRNDENNPSWVWQDADDKFELAIPALQGDIQIQNSAAAIAALKHSDFWPLKVNDINQGLLAIKLSGRLEQLQALDRNWLLDVAHNPASMQVLSSYLQNTLTNISKISVVFSMLADKDVINCIQLLKPFVLNWYISGLDSPRSLSVSDLETQLLNCGVYTKNIHSCNSVATACLEATNNTQPAEHIIVCGSFYTIGDALAYLESV